MALVSDKHRIIFFHIYKTAGMSIRQSMLEDLDEDAYEVVRGHADLKEVFDWQNESELENDFLTYKKFTVVRNPYTWIYSIYKFSQNLPTHPFHIISKMWDFDTFTNWIMDYKDFVNESKVLNGKLQTQTDYLLLDNELNIDFILKYESLDDDYYKMLKQLGIPYYSILPKENIGGYEKPIFTEILSRATLDKINDYYHNDFINFNYIKL